MISLTPAQLVIWFVGMPRDLVTAPFLYWTALSQVFEE
jgi:hypothetical protein